MDINFLVKLSTRAWSIDVLAALYSGVAGRQATLLSKTGASRTALLNCLEHLISLELVQRNKGHGHPLRPEYLLTQLGEYVGETALKIVSLAPTANERLILNRAWSIPVIVISAEPRYFSEIKHKLKPITDRALSQSIQLLEKQNWLGRRIDIEHRPPRPIYQTCNTGKLLSQTLIQSYA